MIETRKVVEVVRQEEILQRILFDYVETIREVATPVSDDNELYYYSLNMLEACSRYNSDTGELKW